MVLCRFYQQGQCKFGRNCRFEHPNAAANNRNQTTNRFGALGGGGVGGGGSAGSNGRGNESAPSKYSIVLETIKKDLTIDSPLWILSAYAPGIDAPDQLFGGYPREQSFEELRLHYLVGKASGNEEQALSEAQQLYADAKQQMDSAASNVDEAARFVEEGENRHPNRHDVCKERTQGAPFGEFLVGKRPQTSRQSRLGSGAPTLSAFGQPSTLGQRANPFGQPSQPSQPAFGQPSQPISAFGQPSQPASAFGQPSALGAKPSPFGTPAFGQPSQPNGQSNPFGRTQPQSVQGSAFGQPSQLGQKPNPFVSAAGPGASPFASISNNNDPPAANPFANPSSDQGTAAHPFASNDTNQNNNAASPFGQPAQQPGPTSFGQPSAPAPAPFTSTSQAANNRFGQQPQQQQQSPFGAQGNQPSNTGNSFGQTNASLFAHQPSSTNTFGQAQVNGNSAQANPFAAPQQQVSSGGIAAATNSPYPPDSTKQHPPVGSYSSRDINGLLSTFKGKPVAYKDGKPGNRAFDGTWTRIWFPDGPPTYSKDTALPIAEHDDMCKTQWAKFAQTGAFADGLMPELPPPRELTQWDF